MASWDPEDIPDFNEMSALNASGQEPNDADNEGIHGQEGNLIQFGSIAETQEVMEDEPASPLRSSHDGGSRIHVSEELAGPPNSF